jgi:hypothetical protein
MAGLRAQGSKFGFRIYDLRFEMKGLGFRV